jgi:hypothetical protein
MGGADGKREFEIRAAHTHTHTHTHTSERNEKQKFLILCEINWESKLKDGDQEIITKICTMKHYMYVHSNNAAGL